MPHPRHLLLMLPAMLALSGCVAVAIPIVAGGAVARSAAKGKAASRQAPSPPPVAPRKAAVAASLPPPLPGDLATMRPGQLYTGAMPKPSADNANPTAPVAGATRADSPSVDAETTSDWSDIGHYVAANLSPKHSVLLARGSDGTNPRWVGCNDKPRALLVTAATVVSAGAIKPAARLWLDALRVMDVRAIVAAIDISEATTVRTAFAKAGLAAPADGDNLLVTGSAANLSAIRADVGARYCVVALVGRAATDFPNGLTPATTPSALMPLWGNGWFRLSGSAN